MSDETPADDQPLTISRRKVPLTVETAVKPMGRPPKQKPRRPRFGANYNTDGLLRGHAHKPEYIAQKAAELNARTSALTTREGMLQALREIAADEEGDQALNAIKVLLASATVEEDRPPANVTEWINGCYQRSLAAEAPK